MNLFRKKDYFSVILFINYHFSSNIPLFRENVKIFLK